MSKDLSSDDKGEPLQLFEICMDRTEYFPGEILTGKLLIVTSCQIRTQGVFVKFEGKGSVKWKTRSAHLCGLQEAEYAQEKRRYFSNIFRYTDLEELPEGSSILNFEFELPTGIPQSIARGTVMRQLKISYAVEALIRVGDEDYRQHQCFTVKGILNLAGYPELTLPICKTVREAMFDSCWSSSGRVVGITFSIRKQGFVPGEKIQADVVIKNSGGRWAKELPDLELEMQLIQEMDVQIEAASRVQRRIVAKQDGIHVVTQMKAKESEREKNCKEIGKKVDEKKLHVYLTVPEDILVSYGHVDQQVYDFICIRYQLRLSIEQTSFPYKPVQINLPIKIGTVFIKEQSSTRPVLLLAPVPMALPRPRLHSDVDMNSNGPWKAIDDENITAPDSNITALPQITINSTPSPLTGVTDSLLLSANPTNVVKKKGIISTNAVGDSSEMNRKSKKAFDESDSSGSESFRSAAAPDGVII